MMIPSEGEKPKAIEIIYFPVRARQENIRMMLEYAKMDYTYTYTGGAEYREDRKSMRFPFGSLPILEITTQAGKRVTLAQSGAITRYLAKFCGLYPSDPYECGICDSVFEHGQDMASVNPIVNIYKGEAFEAKKEAFFSKFEFRLKCLLPFLGDGPFFNSRKTPLYCDFMVYHVLDNARTIKPECLKDYPRVLGFLKAFEALPGVSEYLQARPKAIDVGTKPMLDPTPKPGDRIQRTF